MDHTHIVRASDFDRYSFTRESQEVIPELIYWLVKQSCPNLSTCRIPFGNDVNQPGFDGIVETDKAFLEFVPKGKSYWEIGTGTDPQAKATRDFNKRTKELNDSERANLSFIFVTPRSSGAGGWNGPKQKQWLGRRRDKGWKKIRIIDGVKLADWLREFPAIGKWMAKKINLTGSLGGLSTPTEHWKNLIAEKPVDDPPLPPKLFIKGRDDACRALQEMFQGKKQYLMLVSESTQDVIDFISAFLAGLDPDTSHSYSNRCLFINDEEAWRSIVEVRTPHVLVSGHQLSLETEERVELRTIARQNGHSIIIPVRGVWSGNTINMLKLRSPSQSQIGEVLREAGYSDVRARELARIGGDRISALRRHLRDDGEQPPYATWGNATLIAQAGLVGKWDGSRPADRSALENLLGKKYREWSENLMPDALRSDSPLIRRDEKWQFTVREEAWNVLGNRITSQDLERFQDMAVAVLGERNLKFYIPKEERLAVNIHEKNLAHSTLIREGLAETLALLGSRPKALSSCPHKVVEGTAILVVRRLLNEASWGLWASLDSLLPLLAEAAPDEFLGAIEAALVELDTTLFQGIFSEEGRGDIGGWNYMSGILEALEVLAWDPEYLCRVSVILAELASIDPGGSWSNRPSHSLATIFLPWLVQTAAPFKKRKYAIEAVLQEQSEVGWKLLLDLLPNRHSFSSGCHRPVWREYIPREWNNNISMGDYWEHITVFSELALVLAKKDSSKLYELSKLLLDLPESAHNSLLEYLSSEKIVSLPEGLRMPFWEKLNDLAQRPRRFAKVDWKFSKDAIKKIEKTAKAIAPHAPEMKYHYLFNNNNFNLLDEKGSYSEQRARLDVRRQSAVKEILDAGALPSVLAFADNVAVPYEVGQALGVIAPSTLECEILPSHLNSESETLQRVIAGYIRSRYQKFSWPWIDETLSRNWTAAQKSKFLAVLPFQIEVWQRVATHLSGKNEQLYWKDVNVNPYDSYCELGIAIEKLLQYGRPAAAVLCADRTKDDAKQFDQALAIRALLNVLDTPLEIPRLDNNSTAALIMHLQSMPDANQDALFQIEWSLLPWLDPFFSGSPKTLEKYLASDPSFFAKIVRLVFRSKNDEMEETEPDEQKKKLARNAYDLLTKWKRCPGIQDNGMFDIEAFNKWIHEARRITKESGHAEVAQIQIGHVLTYAPTGANEFWIHESVASILDGKDTHAMRSGFTTELFNRRGVCEFTHGREERELANQNREKAEALDAKGYTRFATKMREFSGLYDRQAERDEQEKPFDD